MQRKTPLLAVVPKSKQRYFGMAAAAPNVANLKQDTCVQLEDMSDLNDTREEESWIVPESPRDAAASHSHKGSEFSLEYLPNPTEVIEALNDIRVRFTFDDEQASDEDHARKRRATITRSQDSFEEYSPQSLPAGHYHFGQMPLNGGFGYPLSSIPNERDTIQTELIEKLETIMGIEPMRVDDGLPRLGIYTQEERVERINAYREKRKARVFGKVRYVLRKRASEGRSRFKGRFAKEGDALPSPATTTASTPGSNGIHVNRAEREVDTPDRNVTESTSWLEKMSIGARRMSGSFSSIARKRMSLPSQPASPFFPEDDPEHCSSWSSWLLKSRRKSSTSNSGRFSDRAPSAHISSSQGGASDEADDVFFREQVEPDRKRLTSGSSAVFADVSFDPNEVPGMAE